MWFEKLVGWFTEAANTLAFAQLVAAFVTAIATIALWRVTRVLADETKTLAAMTSRPFVVSSFESSEADPTAIDVVFRNTGNATAFDVVLRITPALPNFDGKPATDPTETKFKIGLLPQGQSLPFQGVMSRDVPDDVEFSVEVSWGQTPGALKREKLEYKTHPRDGFRGGWGTKKIHHIGQELEKIRKHIENN